VTPRPPVARRPASVSNSSSSAFPLAVPVGKRAGLSARLFAKRSLIVKLQATVTALKQSAAKPPIHKVGRRGIHLVDLVRRLAQAHTITAAGRATGVFAAVDQQPPSVTLALPTLPTFEHTAVGQFLRQRPAHPKERSSTMSTDFQAPNGHVVSL
jgi:hypothetical protein